MISKGSGNKKHFIFMKKGVMGLIMEKGKLIKTLYCILFLIWFVCFFLSNGLWSGKSFENINLLFLILTLITILCMSYLKHKKIFPGTSNKYISGYGIEISLLFITLFEFVNYMFHDEIQTFINNLN